MDIQRADITLRDHDEETGPVLQPDAASVEELAEALMNAEQPLILAGGGLRCARAIDIFRALVNASRIPVVYSLMGVDALPCDHPLRVGMIGTYGNRWANLAVGQSDLLLAFGSRLDIRQTGADVAAFKGERTIYHVDIDPGEINNRIAGCNGITADLKDFLPALLKALEGKSIQVRSDWIGRIDALRRTWPDTDEQATTPGINPNRFMHSLSRASKEASAFVVDVGQHQMWAAQSLRLGGDQRMLTSGGMGAMGYALPAGIGATYATGSPVVVIAGDGGFQANVQELETVIRNRLPLKMVVMNNRSLGMVRQFQQSYFGSRFQSTIWGYGAPDFARVAEGFGIPATTVGESDDLDVAMAWLWQKPAEPKLLQVHVSQEANAYPKIAFGSPFTEMEP